LEEQLTTWTSGMKSPDRLDALVWAVTELMGPKKKKTVAPDITVVPSPNQPPA